MMKFKVLVLATSTVLGVLFTTSAKACDSFGPIVVDENGNHIINHCFVAPDPEPPDDREGSGEMTFNEYLRDWCMTNGEYFINDGDYYACSTNQYYMLRKTWVEKGGVLR